MDQPLPIHLVSASPETGRRVLEALNPLSANVHDSVSAVAGSLEGGRCAIVVDALDGASFDQVLDFCRRVADRDQENLVFLAEDGDDGVTFRPLSLGFAVSSHEVEEVLDPDGATWPPFELHEILRFIARIRHDINNPLTAGMAETQLLLMDHGPEGELGESLTTIQRQLKRIQALVQDLAHLRRPPKPEG